MLDVLAIGPGQGWRADAACRTHGDRADFTSDDPDAIARAKAVCAGCPVLDDCREYAVTRPEPWWVWGGLDEAERRLARARWLRAEARARLRVVAS